MNEHIERILEAARKRPTAFERNAYLDRACGDNHALRSEVEKLLKADRDAAAPCLAGEHTDPEATILQAHTPGLGPTYEPPTAEPGQMIGRY